MWSRPGAVWALSARRLGKRGEIKAAICAHHHACQYAALRNCARTLPIDRNGGTEAKMNACSDDRLYSVFGI